MGRASSSKKVARAARAGGKPGESKNWLWIGAIVAVVAVGAALIYVSRGGTGEGVSEAAPQPGDHWHAAYGLNICGEWQPPVVDQQNDRVGIHTHADGLIHMHPFSSRFGGENADIGQFAEEVRLEVADDSLTLPDGRSFEDGDDCDGEEGAVRLTVWDNPQAEESREIESDLADYAPQNNEVVAISFAPEDAEIDMPPTAIRLQDPLAAEEGRQPLPIEGVPPAPEGAITDEVDPDADTSPEEGVEDGFVEPEEGAEGEAPEGDAPDEGAETTEP